MLTEFGKTLRKLRIDNGEVLKNMAEKLGCTASYLSAVETGKRSIPNDWIEKIIALYNLSIDAAEDFREVTMKELRTIKIDLDDFLGVKKETAVLFAREFSDVDDATAEQIRKLLKKSGGE